MNGGPLEEQILLSQVEGSIQKPPILISRNKPEDEEEGEGGGSLRLERLYLPIRMFPGGPARNSGLWAPLGVLPMKPGPWTPLILPPCPSLP